MHLHSKILKTEGKTRTGKLMSKNFSIHGFMTQDRLKERNTNLTLSFLTDIG